MHMKVISVDDSETISNHIKAMLDTIDDVIFSGHAFEVSEAIQLIETCFPDVVLLDIMLKEESGIDLLAYIKNHYPGIKVIILSNHSEQFYKTKCKELGASYFLDKSYEFDKLPQILAKLKTT